MNIHSHRRRLSIAAYGFFDVVSVHPERMSGYRDKASMNRITVAFLVVLAALTAGAGTVLAAIYAQETLDRYFRIEYDVSPAAARTMVSGYVYNQRAGGYRAERMQLSIERLDAAGKVIGTSTTWVLGGVPPGDRAFFSARVEPAASYRVQVLSFDWTVTGGG